MQQSSSIVTWAACLLLWAFAISPVNAQATYPPADEAWDGTSYRALVQRVEGNGLALPTLADAATKPVFERMVHDNNIPLRMGLNRDLSVTIRFQRLDSALDPIHKLSVLYAKEMQKGKPYAQELARMLVYEAKVYAALLDLAEPYLATRADDKRYQVHVTYIEQVKAGARQFYATLVENMVGTQRHSKADALKLIAGALAALPSYHKILTDQDRQELTQKLSQQVSATSDQQLKTALTELRDTIKHKRVPA